MRPIYYVVLGIVVLAINNIVLLKYIGYFDRTEQYDSDSKKTVQTKESTSSTDSPQSMYQQGQGSNSDNGFSNSQSQFADDEMLVNNSLDVFDRSFAEFSKSDTFLAIMDQYSMSAGRRTMTLMEKYSQMSAEQILGEYQDSSSLSDRQMALQALSQGKMTALSVLDLKELYFSEDGELFGRYQVLQSLLEKNDTEAIGWAKAALSDPQLVMQGGYEIFNILYDKEPDFIKDYVNNLRLSDLTDNNFSFSFLLQDLELQRIFYRNNFDEVIDSDNTNLFQMSGYNIKLDLNRSQQVGLVQLLASDNRHKRNFAISMIRNVKDPELVRDSFLKLSRAKDKKNLLAHLNSGSKTAEHQSLIQELSALIEQN